MRTPRGAFEVSFILCGACAELLTAVTQSYGSHALHRHQWHLLTYLSVTFLCHFGNIVAVGVVVIVFLNENHVGYLFSSLQGFF